jgi:Zn-dependent peptidase ImmA (M78 family)
MTLRRGFQAEAERIAAALRTEVGLQPHDPIQLQDVAAKHGVAIVSAADLVDIQRLADLDGIQAYAFSACTFDIQDTRVIVFNPLRSEERRMSDIAHELSHLLLNHELTEIREVAGVPFRTCRSDQEEEATALGGTLLLPRPLLLREASRGLGADDIARAHSVTVEMARYRFNTTGVARQIERARTLRAR